jgi:type I restriction enzyme M protein
MARPRKITKEGQTVLFAQTKTTKEAFRDVRNYLAGQFVGATRDDVLLDEVLKCLFCKLLIERGKVEPLAVNGDPFALAKRTRSIFSAVRNDFPDIYESNAEILLDPHALTYVMKALDFSIMDATSDPIGDAFEVFIGSESRGNAGQFFTPRSVANLLVAALDPKPGETILDPACGAGGFLTSVCAHLANKGLSAEALISEVSKHFYGIDKDAHLAKLARVHAALLTNGHPHIICGDSIALTNGTGDILNHLPKEGVDVLLTNPPFGVHIVAANPEVLQSFTLARKWVKDKSSGRLAPSNKMQNKVPPQVLFIERCISLLKPGGRLGMVVPESILSNKTYRHVVEYLLEHVDLHAVLGMPDALFKTSGKGGTHTKTCLLVATKRRENVEESKTIFMAEAKWCGQDSRARLIPHNDLPMIANNFLAYSIGKNFPISTLGFVLPKEKILTNVLCPRYYDPKTEEEIIALSNTHDLYKFSDLIEEGILSLSTGDEIGKLSYGTGTIPFIRTSDISNWELKADPKHGVSKEIYEALCVKQDVQTGDVLLVRDGTYLIGTCAIVTEQDRRILFQSHLYKIRVNSNKIGLNPYLLLASLSCPIVQKQIRSKQFTQDIIDSLGERIHELVLPIPKKNKERQRISKLVQLAVEHRIKARNLAYEARLAIASQAPQDPQDPQDLLIPATSYE